MPRQVFVRLYAVDNGLDDYQVVVKPNNPPLGLNRFGILGKQEALDYATDAAASCGGVVVDETE